MGDWGLKITKTGFPISSTDPNDYNFWSKYGAKSVKWQGSLSVTTTSDHLPSPVTNSYTHNFGYIPQIHVFTTSYDGKYINANYLTGGAYGKDGELWDEIIRAYATSTTIVVSADLTHGWPGMGDPYGIIKTYDFDILLFMEEVETS